MNEYRYMVKIPGNFKGGFIWATDILDAQKRVGVMFPDAEGYAVALPDVFNLFFKEAKNV